MSKLADKINAVKEFVKYYILAEKRVDKEGGILYEFFENVLRDNRVHEAYKEIEELQEQIRSLNIRLTVKEVGGGSRKFKNNNRKLSDLVKYSSIKKKYGQLLFKIVQHYKPKNIFELGTSIGVSSMYLAKGNAESEIDTIEANQSLLRVAQNSYRQLKIQNVAVHQGLIESELPKLLLEKTPQLVFIDGNHTYDATVKYYLLLKQSMDTGALIFDDIYWSVGMQNAWEYIKSKESLTIDLYQFGIVFFKQNADSKHCRIRF